MSRRGRKNLIVLFENSQEDDKVITSTINNIAYELNCKAPDFEIIIESSLLEQLSKLGIPGTENEIENNIEHVINKLIDIRTKKSRPRMFVITKPPLFGNKDSNKSIMFDIMARFSKHVFFSEEEDVNFIGYAGNLLSLDSIPHCDNRCLTAKYGTEEHFSYLPRLYYLVFNKQEQVFKYLEQIQKK